MASSTSGQRAVYNCWVPAAIGAAAAFGAAAVAAAAAELAAVAWQGSWTRATAGLSESQDNCDTACEKQPALSPGIAVGQHLAMHEAVVALALPDGVSCGTIGEGGSATSSIRPVDSSTDRCFYTHGSQTELQLCRCLHERFEPSDVSGDLRGNAQRRHSEQNARRKAWLCSTGAVRAVCDRQQRVYRVLVPSYVSGCRVCQGRAAALAESPQHRWWEEPYDQQPLRRHGGGVRMQFRCRPRRRRQLRRRRGVPRCWIKTQRGTRALWPTGALKRRVHIVLLKPTALRD